MPQEPKKKHSKSVKRTRRASISLKQLGLTDCKNCGQKAIMHTVCKSCGFYKGNLTRPAKTAVKTA